MSAMPRQRPNPAAQRNDAMRQKRNDSDHADSSSLGQARYSQTFLHFGDLPLGARNKQLQG
jgi:hypothetical protein